MSDPEGPQLVLFSREFSLRKHQDSRENKTDWFREGPNIKCFIIFLDFHLNLLQQQQRNKLTEQSESKQSTRYLKEHKFNSQNYWINAFAKNFPYIICIFFLH